MADYDIGFNSGDAAVYTLFDTRQDGGGSWLTDAPNNVGAAREMAQINLPGNGAQVSVIYDAGPYTVIIELKLTAMGVEINQAEAPDTVYQEILVELVPRQEQG